MIRRFFINFRKIEIDFLHLHDYKITNHTMPMTSEQKSYYKKKYYLENRERILEQQRKYQDKKRQQNAENEKMLENAKMLENIALDYALKEIKLVSLSLVPSNII